MVSILIADANRRHEWRPICSCSVKWSHQLDALRRIDCRLAWWVEFSTAAQALINSAYKSTAVARPEGMALETVTRSESLGSSGEAVMGAWEML
jgi:GH15 family glucan-1,4-alpha-glucosidase